MTATSLELPQRHLHHPDPPIRTVLDPRFHQPGRYSEYGVPHLLRPAADALYQAMIGCPEVSQDVQLVESALLRLLEPWAKG